MLIDILLNEYSANVNIMVYADDFSAAWNSQDLRRCWGVLIEIGPKFGYYPELKQTWLIIKSSVSEKVESVFFGTKIKDNNRRFLISWRISRYTQVKVNEWISQLELLSKIAAIEPQSSYCALTAGFKYQGIPDI